MTQLDQNEQAVIWEENFLIAFFRMIQTLRLYDDNNQLTKQCVIQFKECVDRLFADETLTVLISSGRVYIQGEKLSYRRGMIQALHDVFDFFGSRKLQGLVFYPAFKSASFTETTSFVRLLIASAEKDDPVVWLTKSMEGRPQSGVEFIPASESETPKHRRDQREKARTTYMHAQSSIKEVAQKLALQGHSGIRKTKRMVQNMIDVAIEDESILLGLSTIRDYDDYTYSHSVNVSVLSICLGNRIGLSRTSLTYLGICGLFHDLGKVEVPREILNKPGKLNDHEWHHMRKHPLSSVRQILKLGASHDLKARIVLAPFEHHLKLDLSGYPHTNFKKKVSLFGRILQITDFYDAVTSPRVYRAAAFTPNEAIHRLLAGAGREFDLILARVFATMMGSYPVGTLLRLDTGEIGLVMGYPKGVERSLPQVVLLESDTHEELSRGEVVDLDERNPGTGTLKRNVLGTIQPETLGVQPARFLV
ncbi:MAG: HD-GYP domain-containing protein [Syntrophobacteraceae bacterium]